MTSLLSVILGLLVILVLLALEAWFVVSLILFIVSVAKKRSNRKSMTAMFIVSGVLRTVLPFVIAFLVIMTRYVLAW